METAERIARIALVLFIAWNVDRMIWGRNAWWRH